MELTLGRAGRPLRADVAPIGGWPSRAAAALLCGPSPSLGIDTVSPPLQTLCRASTENRRSKASLRCPCTGLQVQEAVYYFKKTELISLKRTDRRHRPPVRTEGAALWGGPVLVVGERRRCVFSHPDVFVKVIHAVCLSDKYPDKGWYLPNYL